MNAPLPALPTATGKQRSWTLRRRLLLAASLLLLLINPLLHAHLGITWIQGWYQSLGIGELRLISPLEGLESLLVSRQLYLPTVIGMLVPLLIAALLGRVFCSWVCPISLLAEMVGVVRDRLAGRPVLRDRLVLARRLLWGVLMVDLLLAQILGAPLFVFLSPPGLVGRELMLLIFFRSLAWEGLLIILILALELVTRRFYCRTFCPLGGLLALVGMGRRLVVRHRRDQCTRCGRCDRACPLGLAPSRGESLTAYCWNCGICIDACDSGALCFLWRQSRHFEQSARRAGRSEGG